jgi:hypothetical protein
MAKFESEPCPVAGGCDKLTCVLSKVGINRSLLVTLALLPFAWTRSRVAEERRRSRRQCGDGSFRQQPRLLIQAG